MSSLGEAFQTIVSKFRIWPDGARCEGCGFFRDRDYPQVVEQFRADGHPEREIRLGFCKCDGMEWQRQQVISQRWFNSNIPHRREADRPRTFRSFERRAGNEEARNAALTFCKPNLSSAHILLLTGQRGTGKSHLIEAICRTFVQAEMGARYEFVPELLDSLKATFDRGSPESMSEKMAALKSVRLLCLDDIGAENATEWAQERLLTLVDHRIRHHGLLVASTNLGRDQMADKMGERLASRLWDETTNTAHVVYMGGEDYRA